MAVLAVIIPLLMLGMVLALGRYEELLLSEEEADRYEPVVAPPSTAPGAAAVGRREKPGAT
jgi:hypothetical protein